MMTDREMLELAAKAIGLESKWDQPRGSKIGWLRVFAGDRWPIWNPFEDDGEAFRLVTKLDFNIYHAASAVFVEDLDEGVEVTVGHEKDKLAATRRAIVMAAAQIGEAM